VYKFLTGALLRADTLESCRQFYDQPADTVLERSTAAPLCCNETAVAGRGREGKTRINEWPCD